MVPFEIFEGGSAEDFQLEIKEGGFIDGFVEGIVGMSLDETKELSLQFPDDYPQEDLAGKATIFTVTVKELKEKELPELDDDFAEEVSEFETLEELRQSLEKRYQEEAQDKTEANQFEALLAALLKAFRRRNSGDPDSS
jgi:trigger factor